VYAERMELFSLIINLAAELVKLARISWSDNICGSHGLRSTLSSDILYSTDHAGKIRQPAASISIADVEHSNGEKIMSKLLMFRRLPFLALLIMAPCQAETAYQPMERPSTTNYPQYYGYGGIAATPITIPHPIYQRGYPWRYGPNPVGGIPIPIPAPYYGDQFAR